MYKFFAMTSPGLEDKLIQELEENNFKVSDLAGSKRVRMGAYFEGDVADCYRANLILRTATRILWPLKSFIARTNEELYSNIYEIPFEEFATSKNTILVHATTSNSVAFQDQRFVALKTKDAVVDRFRDKFGERPNVEKRNPDLVIHVRVVGDEVDVSLDTTGDSLSQRGYREETVMAPLREHLAAGLLMHSGWKKDIPIVDPMCGSGTFLIEAALVALNKYPALDRKRFQFKKYSNYDENAFQEVASKLLDEEKENTELRFFGYDIDNHAVRAAKKNVHTAELGQFISVARGSVAELTAPAEKGMIIVNPPYGERLEYQVDDNLKDVYRDLGYSLKQNFKGWDAWVLSGHKDLVQLMGLKSEARIPVWNGPIECRFLKYTIRS